MVKPITSIFVMQLMHSASSLSVPIPLFAAVISSIVLGAALYVILSRKYAPNVEHWAYATVGTIVGFWLRG
jgi:hypothetical protein